MNTLSIRPQACNTDFQLVSHAMLADNGLPMASVLPACEIERIFRQHDALFGNTYNSIYNTAIVLWAFLSQTLADGKMRSCSAAVARISNFLVLEGKKPPSTDSGEYCNARKKLSSKAIRQLTCQVADKIERTAPEGWLWHGRHAKLVDGFTATMPDTDKNLSEFPHPKTQKPGVGLPILRACVILSLATACVLDAKFGPYSGKETGESALLREMLDTFAPGDIAVFDRYYASYMMLAQLTSRGIDVCATMHQRRPKDFRYGRRLGKYDRLITWTRPQRPLWMTPDEYAAIPETMTLRMVKFHVQAAGYKAKTITVVTTLIDPKEYTAEEIAELYGHRWNVELDIRQIKQTLGLDHMRCKSPKMIRKEFWATLLAYNLIRRIICTAAIEHGKEPRRISFTRTCATILAAWPTLSLGLHDREAIGLLLRQIASFETPLRPGRMEPRVIRRRRHRYKLMTKPRSKLKKPRKHTTVCRTIT